MGYLFKINVRKLYRNTDRNLFREKISQTETYRHVLYVIIIIIIRNFNGYVSIKYIYISFPVFALHSTAHTFDAAMNSLS